MAYLVELAPHITGARPATTSDEKMRAVACRFVLYLLRRGESGPARRFVKDLYVQWRDQLGPDDPHTLKAATEYAHAEHVLGNIHAAHQIIADTLIPNGGRWATITPIPFVVDSNR